MAAKKTTRVKVPVRKPRNPFVAAALARQAGSHEKPEKSKRQQLRQRLQRKLPAILRGDDSTQENDTDCPLSLYNFLPCSVIATPFMPATTPMS